MSKHHILKAMLFTAFILIGSRALSADSLTIVTGATPFAKDPSPPQFVPPPALPPVGISPEQVKRAMDAGLAMVLIDVRGELDRDMAGHIPGDISIPMAPKETFIERARPHIPNPQIPIVVYCRLGKLSAEAGALLAAAGYRVFLLGAFSDWPY